MNEIIPNGTEVLIFKYVKELGNNQDEHNYIVGVVKNSIISEDLGLENQVRIYEVIGEDGNYYAGTYGVGMVGKSFFRTVDDHISYLEGKIRNNFLKMEEMKNENSDHFRTIDKLKEHKIEKVRRRVK